MKLCVPHQVFSNNSIIPSNHKITIWISKMLPMFCCKSSYKNSNMQLRLISLGQNLPTNILSNFHPLITKYTSYCLIHSSWAWTRLTIMLASCALLIYVSKPAISLWDEIFIPIKTTVTGSYQMLPLTILSHNYFLFYHKHPLCTISYIFLWHHLNNIRKPTDG